jgi:hypothetical protein
MLGRAALHLTSAERAEGRTPCRAMPEGKTGGFRTAPAVLTNNAWVEQAHSTDTCLLAATLASCHEPTECLLTNSFTHLGIYCLLTY